MGRSTAASLGDRCEIARLQAEALARANRCSSSSRAIDYAREVNRNSSRQALQTGLRRPRPRPRVVAARRDTGLLNTASPTSRGWSPGRSPAASARQRPHRHQPGPSTASSCRRPHRLAAPLLPRAEQRGSAAVGGSPAASKHRFPSLCAPVVAGAAAPATGPISALRPYAASSPCTSVLPASSCNPPPTPPTPSPAAARPLRGLPQSLRQTVTFQRTEFAFHYRLHRLAMRPSSATPTPPAEGGIENAIGRVRRLIPAKPTSPPSQTNNSTPASPPTTTHPENALTSKPPPRSSSLSCCTSSFLLPAFAGMTRERGARAARHRRRATR